MSFIILSVAILAAGCSKPTEDLKPPSSGGGGTGGGGGTKNAASFTSNPVLSPDTMWYKTPALMSWGALYTKGATMYVGTTAISTAADFQSANVPALDQSTTGRVDLIGEDDRVVSKNVNYPLYDSNFTYICKGSPKWKMTSAIRYYPGGSVVLSLDPNLWVYYRTISGSGRAATAIHTDGSTASGVWYHLNGGQQYGDGLYVWNNSFPNPTTWVRSRTDGTNTWVVTCIIVP